MTLTSTTDISKGSNWSMTRPRPSSPKTSTSSSKKEPASSNSRLAYPARKPSEELSRKLLELLARVPSGATLAELSTALYLSPRQLREVLKPLLLSKKVRTTKFRHPATGAESYLFHLNKELA